MKSASEVVVCSGIIEYMIEKDTLKPRLDVLILWDN